VGGRDQQGADHWQITLQQHRARPSVAVTPAVRRERHPIQYLASLTERSVRNPNATRRGYKTANAALPLESVISIYHRRKSFRK
jgi:hypothetical protein